MKILLVEDDDNKRTLVDNFVRAEFPSAELRTARSLRSGLLALLNETPDLVILDMSLPTFDVSIDEEGGHPQAYGGRELLRQMDRRGIQTSVVVLTGYGSFGRDAGEALSLGQLDAQLREQHQNTYIGAVFYDATVSGWREALASILRGITD